MGGGNVGNPTTMLFSINQLTAKEKLKVSNSLWSKVAKLKKSVLLSF